MQDLRNKIAVITGAASGIGKAMAQRCANEGMKLVLADIDAAALNNVKDEFETAGTRAIAEQVDVTKPPDLDRLASRAYSHFGAVHLLCNNAGILPPGAPVWREPLSTWHWTLGVNFYGVLHGIQAFVPRMLDAKTEGHVVNTASLAGLLTRPLMSAYNVSKHAVVALSECLYAELQITTEEINVSVLCPAFARTRLADVRNQPEGVHTDEAASFGFSEALKQAVAEGAPPEQIVSAMLDAVREKRFWILPHPQFDPGIRERFDSMLARTNPPLRDLRTDPTPLH